MDEKVLVKWVLRAMRSGDHRALKIRFMRLVAFYQREQLS